MDGGGGCNVACPREDEVREGGEEERQARRVGDDRLDKVAIVRERRP